jgi:hypothetical protein
VGNNVPIDHTKGIIEYARAAGVNYCVLKRSGMIQTYAHARVW